MSKFEILMRIRKSFDAIIFVFFLPI